MAIGVTTDGYREILGIVEGPKEDKSGWSLFLRHLADRGLSGVQLIVSDVCRGLVESAAEVLPDAQWQRCVVHFYRNVFSLVPAGKVRDIAKMLKAIHAQESRKAAAEKMTTVIAELRAMKLTRPKNAKIAHGRFFSSKVRDCEACDLAALCLSPSRATKAVVIVHDYPALLRARRRRLQWSEEDDRLYQRHRWRSEGYHGEAKTWHGLARAVRRGIDNMRIQAFLTAAAVNLKRLAAALLALLWALIVPKPRLQSV